MSKVVTIEGCCSSSIWDAFRLRSLKDIKDRVHLILSQAKMVKKEDVVIVRHCSKQNTTSLCQSRQKATIEFRNTFAHLKMRSLRWKPLDGWIIGDLDGLKAWSGCPTATVLRVSNRPAMEDQPIWTSEFTKLKRTRVKDKVKSTVQVIFQAYQTTCTQSQISSRSTRLNLILQNQMRSSW